jgi:hypothetical protein
VIFKATKKRSIGIIEAKKIIEAKFDDRFFHGVASVGLSKN